MAKRRKPAKDDDATSARLPRGPHTLTREEVAANQQARMMSAMIELVGEQGYGPTTVAQVTARAGVSRKAFYEHFANKEECIIALFDRAIASSPNCADAWVRSSPTYSYLGDGEEAKRRARLGQRLSPLDAHLFFTHAVLCLACYSAANFDEAAVWGRKALNQNPNFTANLRLLTASLAAAGQLSEARDIGRRLLEAEPRFRVTPFCEAYAFRDPARRAAMADHLRAAGLPD